MNAEQRNRMRSEAKRLVESFVIEPLPQYPVLVERACERVQMRSLDRDYYDGDPQDAPTDVKTRWVRNYIRHRMSNYDSLLAEIEGQDSHSDGYHIVRDAIDRKVDAAIREVMNRYFNPSNCVEAQLP